MILRLPALAEFTVQLFHSLGHPGGPLFNALFQLVPCSYLDRPARLKCSEALMCSLIVPVFWPFPCAACPKDRDLRSRPSNSPVPN